MFDRIRSAAVALLFFSVFSARGALDGAACLRDGATRVADFGASTFAATEGSPAFDPALFFGLGMISSQGWKPVISSIEL
jgi:hypothetical protein